jgi:hypothetical protein
MFNITGIPSIAFNLPETGFYNIFISFPLESFTVYPSSNEVRAL